MSIRFDIEARTQLLGAYTEAGRAIEGARRALKPIVLEAQQLLGSQITQPSRALAELEDVIFQMRLDRGDLDARVSLLQAADARTAYLLSINAGQLVNPTLAAQAIDSGWNYDETLLRQELMHLRQAPGPLSATQRQRIDELQGELARLDAPHSVGGRSGDLDSDLGEPRVGVPLRVSPGQAADRGREFIARALEDTADPDRILRDEFEAFFHDNGNLTIVLPGVIDLSRPQRGYDPETNSLRDLDQNAIPSALDSELANNEYGQRVAQWVEQMVETGVLAPGTPTAIVGHSFGSDTAFDLAADDQINGPLLNITHVFGAAYDNVHQFEEIREDTFAVSARNIYDPVAAAELSLRRGHHASLDRLTVELAEEVVDAGNSLRDTTIDLFGAVYGAGRGIHLSVPDAPDLNLVDEVVRSLEPNGLDITFEGAFDLKGFGHDQGSYISFVEEQTDPRLGDFLTELDTYGFTGNAVALSIDVSRPTRSQDPKEQDSEE